MSIKKIEIFSLSQNYILHRVEVKEGKRFYLFNIESGEIYKLNQTAFEFLSLVDGRRNIGDIFEILSKKYRVENNLLWKDFKSLIIEWQKSGIIK